MSRTQISYDHKPQGTEIASMVFQKQLYTVDSFLEDVKKGYSFAYVFKDDDEPFPIKEKTIENFNYTKVVVFDVDHSRIQMNEQIDFLGLKPTIAYTTPKNNPSIGDYRFRLLYCFDQKIQEEYKNVYDQLKETIGLNIKDNCMSTPNQFFNGNKSSNIEIYKSNTIYTKDILKERRETKETKEKQSKNSLLRKKNYSSLHLIVNDLFLDDFYTLSYWGFLDKYRDLYGYDKPMEVPLLEKDDYLVYPKHWYTIPRRKGMVEVNTSNGTKLIYGVKRFKDGEKRHYWLWQAGLMYKEFIEDISPEHLLYLLVYELYFYYDNSDGKFKKDDIVGMVERVMLSEEKPINMKHGAFKVDKSKLKEGESACQKRNEIRKRLNFERIGELYDCNLTDKENLIILKENGVKTSLSTIKRFRNEMGIPSKGRGRPRKRE